MSLPAPIAPEVVELRQGATWCRIAPGLGGTVLSLSIDGAEVLRPTPEQPDDILATGCFALVPFANRIAAGRFHHAGRRITLPPDPAAPPHALHGHGWRGRWTCAASGPEAAEMTYLHPAGAWPWTYRATQRLTVVRSGLAIELAVENLAETAMPCGTGLHPFFAAGPDSYVELTAPERLVPDRRGIACVPAAGFYGRHYLSALTASDDLLLDASGQARIGTAAWEIELTATDSIGWQFFLPPSRAFFCLEPVSHRPDSFNRPGETATIEPGARRCWRFGIARLR